MLQHKKSMIVIVYDTIRQFSINFGPNIAKFVYMRAILLIREKNSLINLSIKF
jgi:hypothetical protein